MGGQVNLNVDVMAESAGKSGYPAEGGDFGG